MLSILIPAYNAAPFIQTSIMSALKASDNVSREILVCDDGSTDNTAQLVQQLVEVVPQVKLIKLDQNSGVCAARNILIANINPTSQYVAFLDADDVYAPNALNLCVQKLKDRPTTEYTFGNMQVVLSKILEQSGNIGEEWPIVTGTTLCAGLFRKRLIDEIGAFDTSFTQGEDIDYLLRIGEVTKEKFKHNDVVFYYRRHDNNTTNNRQSMRSGFMRALLLHVCRRRKDPTLFDAKGLFKFEDRENMQKVLNLYER